MCQHIQCGLNVKATQSSAFTKMNRLLHGLLFLLWLAEHSADAVNEKMHSRSKTARITTCWPRLEIYKQFLKKQRDFLFP